jgi:hypothetical protein
VPSFELSPGVVVDTDRGEAYVMSPEGGIVAVGLADGEPAWRNNDVSKPLALAGELLVGQGEPAGGGDTLRILTLDIAQGGRQVNETVVDLPPGVQASITPSLNRSFTAAARAEPQEAVVDWEFVERPIRGVPTGPLEVLPGEAPPGVSAAALPATAPGLPTPGLPTPGLPPASRTVEPGGESAVVRGTARVDLATGTITANDETRLPTPPGLSPGTAGDSAPAPDLDAPAALPGVPGPQFLSADGRHVLSSLRIADDPAWDKYLWTIFERGSGRRIGEMRMHLRYVPFFVEGSRVIYQTPPYERREGSGMRQEPLQLRAAELDSGAEMWHQPVRDTVDRDPPPP